MMEKRTISRWWWERRERSRESTVVWHCFVGVKDCYVRGEAGSRVHWDLHHTCWCADRGQWPHPCAGLDIAAVWVCQPRTDSLEESEGSPFLAENPRSLQSHLETCEGHESYSLFCYRALKVDGRWNRFIFWLFHSSTKAAFYLCLRELSNLHSHTVLFFLLFFLDYLIIESPKSNTLLSPFRHRGVVIPVPCAGWWECQCSVERVVAVWISNVSLGWSLCPCRCSQLGAGSSRCLIWARTSSLTQPFCAGKSMLTGTKRTALSQQCYPALPRTCQGLINILCLLLT